MHRKDACGVRREAARKRTCHQAPRLAAHPVLYEGYSAAEVADWFGYSVQTLRTLVRDFRAGRTGFFIDARPGPKTAPAKDAARERVIELRRDQQLSIDEIAVVLAREGLALNRTGISQTHRSPRATPAVASSRRPAGCARGP